MLKPGVFGHPVIDCDVHVSVPSTQALMPYFDAYWYDSLMARGMNRTSFAMTCDPPNAPMAARPNWRPKDKRPGADLKLLQGALETLDAGATGEEGEEGEDGVTVSLSGEEAESYEAKLERARDMARNDPKVLAGLIKEWMAVNEEGRK